MRLTPLLAASAAALLLAGAADRRARWADEAAIRPDAALTDYRSLLKVDGRWRIVNKIFTRETRREHVSGS